MTSSIEIKHQPTQGELETLGVFNWSIWTKEASEFPFKLLMP